MPIKLIRSGSCKECTDPNCCEGCLHFKAPNMCSIYFERPKDKGCIFWPPTPFERPNNCNFHFYDADTGKEIIGYKDAELLKECIPVQIACPTKTASTSEVPK